MTHPIASSLDRPLRGNRVLIPVSMCLRSSEQPTILRGPPYLRFFPGSSEALRLEKQKRLLPHAIVRYAVERSDDLETLCASCGSCDSRKRCELPYELVIWN